MIDGDDIVAEGCAETERALELGGARVRRPRNIEVVEHVYKNKGREARGRMRCRLGWNKDFVVVDVLEGLEP